MNSAINQELSLLRDFLDRENELGILIGSHQNTDTYAAALSLFLSLTQSGKKVQIVSKKAPTVEVSNLVAIDKVKENFAAGSNSKLVVALPYVKGEVEKVLFTEAPNTINFHLTAAPDRSITPFELSDVKLMWEGGAPVALITIGVSTTDEIMGIVDPSTSKIVNIDNYSGNTRFGDVVLVDDSFSSLSEVSGKIIKDLNLPMDIDIAQNILDGVMYSTRNFTKGNTSPLAFEAVSAAMYQGAQRREDRSQQSFSNQAPRQAQIQDRANRDQGRDRGNRDGRQQGNRPFGDAQGKRDDQKQPRVSDNDFPAMHMQPNPRVQQDNNRDLSRDTQRDPNRDSRRNMPSRNPQNAMPQRGGQQFSHGSQGSVNDIRNKLIEEKRIQKQFEQPDEIEQIQQVIEDPQLNQPIEDVQMSQEQPSFETQNNEEIPDDWLMPKVFKSSKSNN